VQDLKHVGKFIIQKEEWTVKKKVTKTKKRYVSQINENRKIEDLQLQLLDFIKLTVVYSRLIPFSFN
jgi:hypothetical protein